MLIAMTGLPGSGKTMLAEAVGIALPAVVVSVDPLEAVMWRAGIRRSEPTGLAAYGVAAAVAESQLRLGHPAVVDAVNSAPQARQMWQELAGGYDRPLRVIEVHCSDPDLHRQRLDERLDGRREHPIPSPSWDQVQRDREGYRPWLVDRLLIDSAKQFEENVRTTLRYLSG